MDKTARTIPTELPVVGMDASLMVFPGISSHFEGLDPETILNFTEKLGITSERPWVITVMHNPKVEAVPDKFYKTGVVSEIKVDLKNGTMITTGLYRAEITDLKPFYSGNSDNDDVKKPSYYLASVKYLQDENCDDYFLNSEAAIRGAFLVIRKAFLIYIEQIQDIFDVTNLAVNVSSIKNLDCQDKDAVDQLVWALLCHMPDEVKSDERQVFLESDRLIERIELLGKLMDKHLRIALFAKGNLKSLSRKSRSKFLRERSDKSQNEADKPSQDGNKDGDDFVKDAHGDIKKRWEKFKEIRDFMNEDARDVVTEDVEKLKSFGNPQGNTYEWPRYMRRVDFILGLPWKEETVQEADIDKVAKILDEDHYGLIREKDSICNQVAPRLLNPNGKGPIICFVGPPGVGKTSLAKSIARALNRKYVRMSLGGIRDEAQIRGHGITYIGSEPGEILKLMKRCGVRNPLFVVDEIDKLGHMSISGDPSAAMLEVLDPEQNNSFKDHWAACGFDLSKVLFIATANQEDTIHPALKDRMDVTHLSGYLEIEKVEIAKRHLTPRLMKELGLAQNNIEVVWEEEVISKVIRGYTHEAGVRNLERALSTILKKICREYLKSKSEGKPVTRFEMVEQKVCEYLGPPRFVKDRARPTMIGEAVGLAWTPVGGDILYVQAEMYPMLQDKKVLSRTGMQGKVMQESDEVAMSIMKNMNPEFSKKLSENAIHLHIPEGAVPKDGPSAGITIVTALYSELKDRPVKQNLAMTGEIDLKRRVKAVGGIREKIVAAGMAGIEEIIMPKDNERNLHDVPQTVKDKLKFYFVENVDQALKIAFP